jgi:hypothetical protein
MLNKGEEKDAHNDLRRRPGVVAGRAGRSHRLRAGNVSAGGFSSVSTVEVFVDGRSRGLARNDQFIPGQQGRGLFKMQVTATGSTILPSKRARRSSLPDSSRAAMNGAAATIPARRATVPARSTRWRT